MTEEGLAQLKLDEGRRLQAYPDPDSPYARALLLAPAHRPAGWTNLSREPWTCGYGCTGVGIGPTTRWSEAEADARLLERVAEAEAGLRRRLPWFAALERSSPVRADVLINLAFNLGLDGLMRWPKTLAAIEAGCYAAAATEVRANRRWASQVHARAERCAAVIKNGRWPDLGRAPSSKSGDRASFH